MPFTDGPHSVLSSFTTRTETCNSREVSKGTDSNRHEDRLLYCGISSVARRMKGAKVMFNGLERWCWFISGLVTQMQVCDHKCGVRRKIAQSAKDAPPTSRTTLSNTRLDCSTSSSWYRNHRSGMKIILLV